MKPSKPNNMHMGDKHPFASSWTNSGPVAKTVGVEPKPGGGAKGFRSANSAMKRKLPLVGPGKAI